jgi:hypothetical protein
MLRRRILVVPVMLALGLAVPAPAMSCPNKAPRATQAGKHCPRGKVRKGHRCVKKKKGY